MTYIGCGEIDQTFTCKKQGTKKEEIVFIPGTRRVPGTWDVVVLLLLLLLLLFLLLLSSRY